MRFSLLACSLALGAGQLPAVAHADNLKDAAMRSADAQARDRAVIKRLNEEQLAYVRDRDARYAEGWHAYRNAPSADDSYPNARAKYERRMAEWRRAVAACRGGDWAYCDN